MITWLDKRSTFVRDANDDFIGIYFAVHEWETFRPLFTWAIFIPKIQQKELVASYPVSSGLFQSTIYFDLQCQ